MTNTMLHNGDILLTGKKSQHLTSYAIKLGEKLRFGFKSPYTKFSHAAIVVDARNGVVCEALSGGVKRSNIVDRFPDGDFTIINTGVTNLDWGQINAFLANVLSAKWKYGFTTFAGLAIYCLTGSKLCIQSAGTAICSGLVCDALTRAGYIWERPPYAMTPADIAAHFDIKALPQK
jgi:hypothetical protein